MADEMSDKERQIINAFDEVIPQDLEDHGDETALLAAIEERVRQLMNEDPDLLFSYLYRLDIPQSAIEFALYHSEPLTPQQALAHVILERQRTRLKTRRSYPQKPIEGWDSF